MAGLRGQASEGFFDEGRGDFLEIVSIFALDQLGEGRTGGDRGGAATRLVARLDDAAVLEAHRKAENVAAGRVGGFDGQGRRGQLAGVAGPLEMIEKTFAVHATRLR